MDNPFIFNSKLKSLARKFLSSRWASIRPYQTLHRLRMKNLMRKCEERPLRVRLGNTNLCGANCSFCPHSKMKRKQGIMDMKLYKSLARQCAQWGVPELVIQEFGEPFRDPHFFERAKYAKEIGIKKNPDKQ